MTDRAFLTAKELATRWRLNDQTLANWRHERKGPPYIRVGARVLYPLEGISAFEKLSGTWLGNDQAPQHQHP